MFHSIKELYLLLTIEQRKKLLKLQVFVVLMSIAEVTGVISIGPFMALVGDIQQLQGDGLLADLYRTSGLAEPRDFLFFLGVCVVSMLFLATLISVLTVWQLSIYGVQVGAELSSRLFRYYMYQDWLFHSGGSSSQRTKKISQEVQRVTALIINPLLQINAKAVMGTLMVLVIFIYNPGAALVGLTTVGLTYFLVYRAVRQRLSVNGTTITQSQQQRFMLMGEGFGGIKDVLLLGRQDTLTSRFEEASVNAARAQGVNMVLSLIPRYVMQLLAFGSVIFFILYLIESYNGNLSTILPILSVYALAGLKILPAIQTVYSGISQIRGNLAAFEDIREELRSSVNEEVGSGYGRMNISDTSHLVFKKCIKFHDVKFSYPGKHEPVLRGLNMEIPVNSVIGLVGSSGSGKSTAIDMLLGLIQPESGEVRIDDVPLTQDNRRAWQNSVGYVPQSIFLSDRSILENIAFGLPLESINIKKVQRAASMAHLDELICDLPEGLDTRVGERGVQLSGGQRQRIGIARAFYHDADVLVLDEATSALDGITEKVVMDAIHDFVGKKTVVMIAHRMSTVKRCDHIYFFSNGEIIDAGSYQDLMKKNETFRNMSGHY